MLTIAMVVFWTTGTGAADEKVEPGVEEVFKKFALTMKDDKFEEAQKHLAPMVQVTWNGERAIQKAAANYQAALEQKLGKGDEDSILKAFRDKPNPSDRAYLVRGTIREVKADGKDRVIVTIWAHGPRFGGDDATIYERKITAVKVDGQWRLHWPSPYQGSPVVKQVKRTDSDGKIIDVSVEANATKNWEEYIINFEGTEEERRQVAKVMASITEILTAQKEQVQKGAYKTRQEALDTLEMRIKEEVTKARTEQKPAEKP
jgi:hypothetical protein